ncbi:MAG: hypothetical protein QXS50_03225 [Candidatus Caldarchaeum sp.]
MKTLTVGYALSAVNSFVFTAPTVMIYPALVLYPVSIILRGLGWWRLRRRVGVVGGLGVVVWALGLTCFGFVVAGFLEVFEQALFVALAVWVVYSVVEAVIYVAAARILNTRLLYVSPMSLVGVASLSLTATSLGQGSDLLSTIIAPTLYITTAALFASATASAAALARVSDQAASPRTRPLPSSWGSTTYTTPQTPRTAEVALQTVRAGTALRCPRCKATAPLMASRCISCGYAFEKSSRGLRCPTCSAPFSKAMKLPTQGFFICTYCSTVMRVPVKKQP